MADDVVMVDSPGEEEQRGDLPKLNGASKVPNGDQPMVIDDEDDPVVDEMDVYLGQQLKGYLYLFQYPLRHALLPLSSDPEKINARIKPNQGKVELDIALEMNDHFNTEKAREFAKAHVEGDESGDEAYANTPFPKGFMNKYTLASSEVPPTTHYCVGIMAGRDLHLCPVHKVLQMRPDLSYLNVKPTRSTVNRGGDASEDSEESEEEAKEVTVKIKRAPTERDRRLAAQIKAKDVPEEKWVDLQVHQCKNPHSRRNEVFKRLLCHNTSNRVPFDLSPGEYLKMISARPTVQVDPVVGVTRQAAGIHDMKEGTLTEQIDYILKSVQAIDFGRLCQLVTRDDPAEILDKLSALAVLLHGNWVVKSEVLYPESYKSPISGIGADKLILARDYILMKIYQAGNPQDDVEVVAEERKPKYDNWDTSLDTPRRVGSHFDGSTLGQHHGSKRGGDGFLRRTDIESVVHLESDDLREVLKGLCKLYPSNGWVFKLPTDHKFMAEYPEIVARQTELWDQRLKFILSKLPGAAGSKPEPRKSSKGSLPAASATVATTSVEFVEEIIRKEGILLLSRLQKLCLDKGVTENEMEHAVRTMGEHCNINWLGPVPLIAVVARTSGNDLHDKYRRLIVSHFETEHSIKRKALKPHLTDEEDKQLTTQLWNKLVKEFATHTGTQTWKCKLQ
eukprot:comp19673_c0_seq1/m.23324 comp19673_c0_seq1/g.23324  ORF comp19673_c0_seq1/g.23324 comp19673_c0_seq1/m.23324 type:complete len:676 (-) comp19673_c0_seq1:36-2063(-)